MNANTAVFNLLGRGSKNEAEYRDDIVKYLMLGVLGWNNHLQKEYPIPMGCSTKKVDIMLLSDDGETPLLPIEMKQPSAQDDGVGQLYSYMLFVKLEIGLVIKDKIYVFYFHRDKSYIPRNLSFKDAAWVVSFNDSIENLNLFCEMFAKEKFNMEKMKMFLQTKLQDVDNQRQKEMQIKQIQSEINKELIEDLLIASFDIDDDIVREALADLEITISRKNNFSLDTDKEMATAIQEREYFVDNVSSANKTKFVRAIVKKYMEVHPSMTYDKLRNALAPMATEEVIIKNVEEIQRWVEEGHQSVWRGDEFVSSDNIRFRVYNQWKPNNFHKVINFAKKQGFLN